jgi:hypothetical protein
MLDFLLFTCTHSLISAETAHAVEALHHTSDFKFNWGMVMYDALIGRSRSVACTEFLDKHESEYMIFLDDDIVFHTSDIAKILEELVKGKDVIGGLYATGGGMRLAHRGFNSQMVIDGNPQEIEYLSTGFMGISRNILLKMVNELKLPYIKTTRSANGELSHLMTLEKFPLLHQNTAEGAFYPFFESGARPYSLGGIYISEDWDFDEKVRMVGGKTWAHTGVLVDHIKRGPVTAQRAIQANTVPRVQANHELWIDLALYLGKSVHDLVGKYGGGRAELELGEKWFSKKGSTEDFYKDNELYLYDLTQWNAMPYYQGERLNPLTGTIDSTILDFGCGIGTALFFLASGNKALIGYDINKPALDFAEFRRKKLKLPNVSFTTECPDLAQFDLVIAIDTLEHIEDLKPLILKFGAEMKPGARLYHADMFVQEAGHPMHYDHSASIDSWLKEAGFIVFNKQWAIKP